jgi:hypothetical protein
VRQMGSGRKQAASSSRELRPLLVCTAHRFHANTPEGGSSAITPLGEARMDTSERSLRGHGPLGRAFAGMLPDRLLLRRSAVPRRAILRPPRVRLTHQGRERPQ